MDKFAPVDESDCVSPFDIQADELTLYQAALLWTGRPLEAPFHFPPSDDKERMNWLCACEKSDVDKVKPNGRPNGKPSGPYSKFCNLAKAVEDRLLPAKMAFDRNRNHNPVRTVVRKSDLRQFAEKQWGEFPDFLQDKVSESVAIGGEAETASSGTCEQVEKAEHGKAKSGLLAGDIAAAFDGIRWPYVKWKRNLGDSRDRKWLQPARLSLGQPGKGKQGSSTWDPVELAWLLLGKQGSLKSKLNAVFRTKSELSGWLQEWEERIAQYDEYSG